MAHPDLDKLFDYMFRFAQQMLEKHREFYPFGAVIWNSGELRPCGAYNGSELPRSQDLIDLMIDGFRSQATKGEIQACGICFDVLVTPPGMQTKTDAIQCKLEHASRQAVDVYVPYAKKTADKVDYGTAFAVQGKRVVFGATSGSTSR